ncbi:methyltransferases [Striga hermonthica]|uniref:Methyltransferases n=1 Tax=Striga hermonthica TaxID=68872 RepID=A0A9N7P266_STRHE|nr:methyltransferases [Striga hermonthica]
MQALGYNPRLISALRRPSPRLKLRQFSSSSSSNYSDQSRGGRPRFFSETLPSSKGGIVRVKGDEFWHMTRVLRLGVNDRCSIRFILYQ